MGKRDINWEKIIFWFVFITLVVATAYVIVMIVMAPLEQTSLAKGGLKGFY